jgi:DNA invertase Pin-like site-specific DNA recombinase
MTFHRINKYLERWKALPCSLDTPAPPSSIEDQLAVVDAQVAAFEAEGCEKLFQERLSAAAQREQLEVALVWAREGDTLVVTTMDRLARSNQHLLEIVEGLERKGVALRLLDFKGHGVDTHSRQGKLVLTMFAAFAQFERELMLERQPDGIAKAGLRADARDASPPPWPRPTR